MSSRSYRLKAKEGAADGVRRIAAGRAAAARDELIGTGDGDLAAAIHGARKDLKKLRAVVRLVRKELGEELFKAENRRYRDAGRALARTRDAEVKLTTLAALRRHYGEGLPRDASKRWQSALERERDALGNTARSDTAKRIGKALKAIEEGRSQIPHWPLATDSWALVEPGLSTSYRQGRQALRRTLAEPSAKNVHAWRKRVKDLWYQLRIVRGAWPALLGATADQAHELADLLGDHHDLAMLAEDLSSRTEIGEHGVLGALLERRQEELLTRAEELGSRLYAEKPKAFRHRLERYWQAWRGG